VESPCCGAEMTESYRRVKYTPTFPNTKYSHRHKSKPKRVYTCPKCNTPYAIVLRLMKAEIVT